jgi:3-hydroxyacyl-[acyl-carrier-protein] dehydratase
MHAMPLREKTLTETMTIDEIKEYLPHRYPFLLIDRVVSFEKDKRIVALKNVTVNEPFFPGHFPHFAVMPGVLVVEAMAQAAAVLSLRSKDHKNDGKWVYYFVGIDGARFKKPVVPGDTLLIDVQAGRAARGMAKFTASARVGDAVVAEAQLLCALREL